MDPVDPLNFGRYAFSEDLSSLGISPRSVFMASGEGDSYVPETTQLALARGMGLWQWVTSGSPLDLPEIDSLPHQRTYDYGDGVTAVLVRYARSGSDGHFVMFENPAAVFQADAFIESMVAGQGAPVLVEP